MKLKLKTSIFHNRSRPSQKQTDKDTKVLYEGQKNQTALRYMKMQSINFYGIPPTATFLPSQSYSQGKFDTDIDITSHLYNFRELNSLLSCSLKVLEGEDLESRVIYQSLGFLHIGALQTSDNGDTQIHVLHGGNQTFGDGIASDNTAEDVDKDGGHLGIICDQTEGLLDSLAGCPASAVKEVGGFPSVQFDDVHGCHGQPSAVDQTSNITVKLDEVETEPWVCLEYACREICGGHLLCRLNLIGILLSLVSPGKDLFLSKLGIVVEI